ncbi:hypothetical protein V8E36_000041, partial [Tilletia maclaganii]
PAPASPLAWPLKPALSGTAAHQYRGPLSAENVLALLDADISSNGRQALTSQCRNGYLKYCHFIGPRPDTAPPPLPRNASAMQGDADDASGSTANMEVWKCKSCYQELTVPADQVSNISAHLYGKKGRIGCLGRRAETPADPFQPPPRRVDGSLILEGASTTSRRETRQRQMASTTQN